MTLPGGKIALATVGACIVLVIFMQVVDDLPWFSRSTSTSNVVGDYSISSLEHDAGLPSKSGRPVPT